MRIATIGLGLAILALACTPNLTGLEEASEFVGDAVEHAIPVLVECESVSLSLGDTEVPCRALGEGGVVLVASGAPLVLWSVSDTSVLTVTADGFLNAEGVGTADVIATGPRNTAASLPITVASP